MTRTDPPMRDCRVCGTLYPVGGTCPNCGRTKPPPPGGAGFNLVRWVWIAVGLAVLAGGSIVVVLLFTQAAAGVGQYGQGLVNARAQAEELACTQQLAAGVYPALQQYAWRDGRFPASLEALVEAGMLNARLLHCPVRQDCRYVYVPGLTPRSPLSCVLVHEQPPAHGGRSAVLHVSGRVELLTPERLGEALKETRKSVTEAGASTGGRGQ